MAEVDFNRFSPGFGSGGYGAGRPARTASGQSKAVPRKPASQRMMRLAGAAISVALAVGAGLWGYKIAVRNIQGIPVIRAEAAPMRVAPETPGGTVAAYQGLSVNDIAAIGAAMPLPEEIVLAPRPADLAPEDIPGLAPEPPAALVAPVAGAPASLPLTQTGADSAVPAGDTPAPEPEVSPVVLALAEALGGQPIPEALIVPETAAPVVPGGIGASLHPLPRPARSITRSAAQSAPAVAAREIDPASLSAGTRLVQFGAFNSADEARAHWNQLAGRFAELMSGKARVIQPAESGSRTFFRLRAEGFVDDADARRFCTAVTAEGADCIPVAQR